MINKATLEEKYRHNVRIYSEHTDSYGIVWHPMYLGFMSQARVEWLRSLGFSIKSLQDIDVLLPILEANIKYHRPTYLDDTLVVIVYLEKIGGASLLFRHDIIRESDNMLICSGQVKVACAQQQNLRPCPWPDALLKEIKGDS